MGAELFFASGPRTSYLGSVTNSPIPRVRVLVLQHGLGALDYAAPPELALAPGDIVRVPLQAATEKLKTVPIERYNEAKSFFG